MTWQPFTKENLLKALKNKIEKYEELKKMIYEQNNGKKDENIAWLEGNIEAFYVVWFWCEHGFLPSEIEEKEKRVQSPEKKGGVR